jgi:hypothetical protein
MDDFADFEFKFNREPRRRPRGKWVQNFLEEAGESTNSVYGGDSDGRFGKGSQSGQSHDGGSNCLRVMIVL